jgi:hypothetical protein
LEDRTVPGFLAPVTYPVGENPISVAVGDFNHDGKLDLVVANASDNTVSVLRGNGDGTFQNAVNYATSTEPEWVTVGVFTGDGNLDIVAATHDGVSFLKGNGDGTFQKAKNFSLPQEPDFTGHPGPQLAEFIVVGDFNGDGQLDLAVGALVNDQHDSNSQGYVDVLLGNGDGSFKTSSIVAVPSLPSIAVGDFNGDGKLDIVAASFGNFVNGLPQGAVNVLLGNGDGTFQAPTTVASVPGTVGVAVGDFNNDGKPDLAISNSVTNDVTVYLGNGDGTFRAGKSYAVGSEPFHLTVGDFNRDGKLDIVTANQGSNNVSLLLGNGNGVFQPTQNFAAGTAAHAVAAGDFNGDGFADLAVADLNYANGPVAVLINDGNWGASAKSTLAAATLTTSAGPRALPASSLTLPGKPDARMPRAEIASSLLPAATAVTAVDRLFAAVAEEQQFPLELEALDPWCALACQGARRWPPQPDRPLGRLW